jgi:hypothetical protein
MIQLKHLNKKNRATFAVDLPLVSSLKGMFEMGIETLPIKIGAAFVHPKENYNKKVGADLAKQRMVFHNSTLSHISLKLTRNMNTRIVFHFCIFLKGPLGDDFKLIYLGLSYLSDIDDSVNKNSRIEYFDIV